MTFLKSIPLARMAQQATIAEPLPTDIKCGKDKTFGQHQGNRRFRQMLEEYVDRYMAVSSKQEKMNLTKEFIHTMKTKYNARFIKVVSPKDAATKQWAEISDTAARDKVSHAIREVAKKRPQQAAAPAQKPPASTGGKKNKEPRAAVKMEEKDSSHTSTTATEEDAMEVDDAPQDFRASAPGRMEGSMEVDPAFLTQQMILEQLRQDSLGRHRPDPPVSNVGVSAPATSQMNHIGAMLAEQEGQFSALSGLSALSGMSFEKGSNFGSTLRSRDMDAIMNEPMTFSSLNSINSTLSWLQQGGASGEQHHQGTHDAPMSREAL